MGKGGETTAQTGASLAFGLWPFSPSAEPELVPGYLSLISIRITEIPGERFSY